MKVKKLYLGFIITCIMALVLAACSGGGEQSSSSEGNNEGSNESSTELAQGVSDDEILIGHLGPQTGPVAIYDLIRKGIDSHFKYVNENGGVNGRQLKLVAYDDQYQPAKTVQVAKRLVEEDKVFAMLGNVCTPCNTAAKDYYVDKGIPMILVSTGAKEFVNPPINNYFGSSIMNYRVEAKIFLDYAVNELGAKKIALAYQNDDYGKEGYEGVKEAIANYPDVEIVEEVTFIATDTEFSSQAQKLQQANPDAILNFSTPNPAANLKKAMHKIGFKDAAYIVSSVGANDNNLFNLAGEDVWEGTYTGATFPMPEIVPDDEEMQLFVERFSKDYPNDPTAGFSQVGWAAAQVFVEALKQTGDDLTWDNFLSSFNTFDNWQGSIYAGVTFSEDNHYGLTTMFMTQAQDGKIVPITDPKTFDPATGEVK
ncbi:ABC transporter substrate-binding protein [Bacillus dakarensis]|uniref:ABC transporter substrate-binding protein n=1 Tax=Robertmurraya dakarensis TaxID=1926278 RepID=UPI000980F53B|nr:ABC transporter substrate-binding protein [Bacillus dakarensis]